MQQFQLCKSHKTYAGFVAQFGSYRKTWIKRSENLCLTRCTSLAYHFAVHARIIPGAMALISRLGCRRSARATVLARTILTSWTVGDSIDVEELTAEVDRDTRDDQSTDAACKFELPTLFLVYAIACIMTFNWKLNINTTNLIYINLQMKNNVWVN